VSVPSSNNNVGIPPIRTTPFSSTTPRGNDVRLDVAPLDGAPGTLLHQLADMRLNDLNNCPAIWKAVTHVLDKYDDLHGGVGRRRRYQAIVDAHCSDDKTIDWTFHDVQTRVEACAGVFHKLGIRKGRHVALFAENSAMWLVATIG